MIKSRGLKLGDFNIDVQYTVSGHVSTAETLVVSMETLVLTGVLLKNGRKIT